MGFEGAIRAWIVGTLKFVVAVGAGSAVALLGASLATSVMIFLLVGAAVWTL
jgi:hypothetical protein